MTRHGLAIFVGSFLLFLIQPIAGKTFLPLYGGGAGVWTVCLLGFQTLLVAGYLWAHFARPRWHLALLAASFAALVFLPFGEALPYVVLASASPLLARWAALEGIAPYRLYALSNSGSLLGLLAYPFAIEPWIPLASQRRIWMGGYVIFAALCAAVALRARDERAALLRAPGGAWWLALSACGTALLAAVTNQMCQEIAPMPLLWILPLAIYLLSFILCFGRPSFYDRYWTGLLAGIAIVTACLASVLGTRLPAAAQIGILCLALWMCLLVCHGELVRARPPAEALTWFYLVIAAGGALGGLFVAVVAPLVFQSYAEFPLLLACAAALGIATKGSHRVSLGLAIATCAAVIVPSPSVDASRNFYGTLRITEDKDATGCFRLLTHGATAHGLQYLDGEARRTPTAYYGWRSAAGVVLEQTRGRIGLVGLGVGTLARYGQAGDTHRIYELNPDVTRMARQWFTFLADSKAKIEIVEGDARLRLRDEAPQRFNALVVDAFSSDSIPVHLLTVECGELYRRHLADDGVLLIHISNRMLRLEPVVAALARHIGFAAWRHDSPGDRSRGGYDAHWMVLAKNEATLRGFELPGARPAVAETLEWTDDFASLWRVLER